MVAVDHDTVVQYQNSERLKSLQVCSKCLCVAYCCREHQREDWPRHKAKCKSTAVEYTPEGWANVSATLQAGRKWSVGLPRIKQHNWFIHCYQMRIDDDMVWGGGNLHGLYDPYHTAESVTRDFLVFCKLAVRNRMLPNGWSWRKFLARAGHMLLYAFEKEDAKNLYGSENVFSASTGGRSLRFTAMVCPAHTHAVYTDKAHRPCT